MATHESRHRRHMHQSVAGDPGHRPGSRRWLRQYRRSGSVRWVERTVSGPVEALDPCPESAGGPVPRSFCRTQSQASGYSKPLRPPGGARRAGASRAGARRALAVGTRAAPASRSPHAESDDAIALLDDRARSQRGNDPPPPSASTDAAAARIETRPSRRELTRMRKRGWAVWCIGISFPSPDPA